MKTLLIAYLRKTYRFVAKVRKFENNLFSKLQDTLSEWELSLIEAAPREIIDIKLEDLSPVDMRGLPYFTDAPLLQDDAPASLVESQYCGPLGCQVNNSFARMLQQELAESPYEGIIR
jgi:hypothetical protein